MVNPEAAPHFRVSQLQVLVTQLAMAAGVPAENADIFAHSLVDADVHGTSTHGVSRLDIYLERIHRGLIDPKAELAVIHQTAGTLAIDAGNGLGQVQAIRTLELMLPIAKKNGVAAATIRRSQHFGALSYYCNYAAARGMILLAMTNCEPAMAPTGGYEPFFGTNPIAASFPAGPGDPVKIDLATSVVARGNIIAANRQGLPLPEGWALNAAGEPTTDAAEALEGTVLTMAGHKGYALATMVEIFSSVLSGAAIGPRIGSMYKDLDREQNVGHFFCLFDVSAFMPLLVFEERLNSMKENLKASKRRPDTDEILIPGERSARKRRRNLDQGVALTDATIADLRKWCEHFGIAFDSSKMQV